MNGKKINRYSSTVTTYFVPCALVPSNSPHEYKERSVCAAAVYRLNTKKTLKKDKPNVLPDICCVFHLPVSPTGQDSRMLSWCLAASM